MTRVLMGETQRKDTQRWWEDEGTDTGVEVMWLQIKEPPAAGSDKEQSLSLDNSLFQTSDIRNCERINFCRGKPPSLRSFVNDHRKKIQEVVLFLHWTFYFQINLDLWKSWIEQRVLTCPSTTSLMLTSYIIMTH